MTLDLYLGSIERIIVPVLVAVIVGGPAWWAARKTLQENRKQHGAGYSKLELIEQKFDVVADRLERIDVKVDRAVTDLREHVAWEMGEKYGLSQTPIDGDTYYDSHDLHEHDHVHIHHPPLPFGDHAEETHR